MSNPLWIAGKLGDVVNLKRGYDLPHQSRSPGSVPIVSSSGVTDFHDTAKVRGPGVVTGRYGTLGEVYFIDRDFWPLNTALYVQDFKGNDPRFVSYFLRGLNFGTQNAAGAVPGVNRNHLHMLDVRTPPVEVQRRIAGILSAYDDLIENCERRIRVLDEMARALYREWFVEFRYPGHEKVPLVDSALGLIPKGWTVKPVSESLELVGGGTPSRKVDEYWSGGDVEWFSPSHLTAAHTMFMDRSGERITERGLAESSATLFPAMSVMMTSRATIGAIAINTTPACTNQGFITCIPNEKMPLLLLFHWLKTNVPLFERLATGATFKEISRGVFRTIDVLHAEPTLVQRFESAAHPMAAESLELQRAIENLRKTRDLLLPRLMSGQLSVEEAD